MNMKKYWLLLLIIVTLNHLLAQWSDPVVISDGFALDFDVDPDNGHLHIVSILNGVNYTETDALGNLISPTIIIPGTTSDYEYWYYGATVAVDNNGYPHVCYRVPKGNYMYDVYYTRKTQSGWLINPVKVMSNQRRAYMVRMAIDSHNRAHIVIGYNTTEDIWGPIAYYRIRNDYPEVEHSIADLNSSMTYFRSDTRIEITVDHNDAIHVISACPGLSGFPDLAPVTYYRSTDGGNTFEYVGDIRNINCASRNGAPDIATDESGAVHMLYGAKIDLDMDSDRSLRYVRYKHDRILIDKPITNFGDLKPWGYPLGYDPIHGKNYGLGSIATSNDGEIVMCAYATRPCFYLGSTFYQGDLYVTVSTDSGSTWQTRQLLAEKVCNNENNVEGRNLHLLRSYKNNFYVVYPQLNPKKIKMRYWRNIGDNPPIANAGGPYTIKEGSKVTLNASGSTDSGQNKGITLYEWDLDNNGTYELSSSLPTLQTTMPDDYYSIIRLKVTDKAGYTDEAESTLRVENLPPIVNAGKDTTINEGASLTFYPVVTDPGIQDTHSFSWIFGNGNTSTQQNPTQTFTNDGQFQVIVTVMDNNNGTDKDTVNVTVNNVPPIANAGGPYVAAINVQIEFTGSAIDPGNEDMQNMNYSWDLNNDSIFESQGQTAYYTFTKEGTFIVWLKVQDNKATNIDSAKVSISNDPPVVSAIPNQTIDEGGIFNLVPLDNYVSDPDQEDRDLTWQVSGQNELNASIFDRILTVSVPDPDWFGSETLTLTVTDAGGLTDSTKTVFTINPVNDAPEWVHPIPDFMTDEDVPLIIPMDSLWLWANDIDNGDNQLIFSVSTPSTVTWKSEPENTRISIQGKQDWHGNVNLIFTVKDPAGLAANDTAHLEINAVPDHPAPFSLIEPMVIDSTNKAWPDSILFIWNATYDPDTPDGLIYYTLTLRQTQGLETRMFTVFDTTLIFRPDTTLPDGLYLWDVTAHVSSGLTKVSDNKGFISVGDLGGSSTVVAKDIPENYQLRQNYPNPFNPETQISYAIPVTSNIEINIYNALGQKIKSLVNANESPGIYSVLWKGVDDNGQKVPSGIYICRMITGKQVFYQKMLLLQ